MSRFWQRLFLLIFPAAYAVGAWAQSKPAPHVESAASKAASRSASALPLRQHLFGAIPLSTKSDDARKSLEQAWDSYENAMYDISADQARRASEKDPNSAMAFAMISFAARRTTPNPAALAKAESLISHATPDEQLLVRWMTYIQERNLLPAISTMNDLLKKYPHDKHILYITGEWLLIQQDDDHARRLLETALQIDPNFPAALNRLGYVYIRNGEPQKAIASLERYAEMQKNIANPQDSLGEVSRIAGNDTASLQHYTASLKLDPNFLASQEGLGDTRTLMGDFDGARKEYDRALAMAKSPVDEFYIKEQHALVSFWEGKLEQGHKELAECAEQAAQKKEPNGQYNIGLAQAMLAADPQSEIVKLKELEAFLAKPLAGMLESDRSVARATVLRERARIAVLQGQTRDANAAISRLEQLATESRDLVVEANYETARGFVFAAQKDFRNAADGLAADPHSPLALQQLVLAQRKLNDEPAAEASLNRLKYQRAPTLEWFLVWHPVTGVGVSAAN